MHSCDRHQQRSVHAQHCSLEFAPRLAEIGVPLVFPPKCSGGVWLHIMNTASCVNPIASIDARTATS